MSRSRIRWGDDDGDVVTGGNALPHPSVSTTKDGQKVAIEYYRNDKGDAFKKTTKYKVVQVEKKVYKVAQERRNWPRFGAAAREQPTDSITVQVMEEIPFERVRLAKATEKEKKANLDFQTAMQSNDKAAVVGSLKDMLAKRRMERELLRAKGLLGAAEAPPTEDDDGAGPAKPSSSLPPAGAGKAGSYVPPSLRNRGAGERMDDGRGDRRRDDNSVRVTNLSEDVSEEDLRELFRPFGHVTRVYLAVNKESRGNRGFAFVNYAHREDAERAIRALNGYGYDNLILRVEWAERRAER